MVKLLSIDEISKAFLSAVKRFPLVVAVAFFCSGFGYITVHWPELLTQVEWFMKLFLTLGLSLPLFIATTLYSERNYLNVRNKLILNALSVIFLLTYWWAIPKDLLDLEIDFVVRYILWLVSFIILISFVSFTDLRDKTKSTLNAFWHFNVNLLESLVLSGIWVFVAHAGIMIALFAIAFLFELQPGEHLVLDIGITLWGIVFPLLFLSRIPKNVLVLGESPYPKEAKLFSKYVLVPLIVTYFAILYAYDLKILLTWTWPNGFLSYLIIGFSFVGIIGYMILYPLREMEKWVNTFGKFLFIALIPQVGMLFFAISFRLRSYGITENRYFIVLFGFWLLGIAIYNLISKTKDLRIIPITFAVILILSSFGPWGAFSVSQRSQTGRLKEILVRNEVLVNGKVKKNTLANTKVNANDRKEILATLQYLHKNHSLDGIQDWFDEDVYSLSKAPKPRKDRFLPGLIMEDLMGIDPPEGYKPTRVDSEYVAPSKQDYKEVYLILRTVDSNEYIHVEGYDEFLNFTRFGDFRTGSAIYNLSAQGTLISFKANGDQLFSFDIGDRVKSSLGSSTNFVTSDPALLTFEGENERAKYKIVFYNLRGKKYADGSYSFDSVSAKMLLMRKDQ